MHSFNPQIKESSSGNGYLGLKTNLGQHPLSCFGKIVDKQDCYISNAILIGPQHILIIAFEQQQLTKQDNVLYFQSEENIKTEISSLNTQNENFFLGTLIETIGKQRGYVGVFFSQNENYYDQFDLFSKKSSLATLRYQNDRSFLMNFYALDIKQNHFFYEEYKGQPIIQFEETQGYRLLAVERQNCAKIIDKKDFQDILRFFQGKEKQIQTETENQEIDQMQCFITNLIEQKKLIDKTLTINQDQKGHETEIHSICRINNQLVATCCQKLIKIWNWKKGILIKTFNTEKQAKQIVCLGPYIFANFGNIISVYNWKFFKIEDNFYSSQEIKILTSSKETNKLLLGFTNGDFKCISYQNCNWNEEFQFEAIFNCSITYLIPKSFKQIILGGENGEIKIFDLETKQILQTIYAHQGKITYLMVNPMRKGTFISCGIDNSLRCWDLISGAPLKKIVLHNQIIACDLLENNQQICLADFKCIRIFNLSNWTYKKIESHSEVISGITSLNFQTFASADLNGNIKISCLNWNDQNIIVSSDQDQQISVQSSQNQSVDISATKDRSIPSLNLNRTKHNIETPLQQNKECLSRRNKKFVSINEQGGIQAVQQQNDQDENQFCKQLHISSINNTLQQLQKIQNQKLTNNNIYISNEQNSQNQLFLNEISEFPCFKPSKSTIFEGEDFQLKEIFDNYKLQISNIDYETPINKDIQKIEENKDQSMQYSHYKFPEEREAKFKSLSNTELFLQIKQKTQKLLQISQELNLQNILNIQGSNPQELINNNQNTSISAYCNGNKQESVDIVQYQSIKNEEKLKQDIYQFKQFLEMSKNLQEELNSFITEKGDCNVISYNQVDISQYQTKENEQNCNNSKLNNRTSLNETYSQFLKQPSPKLIKEEKIFQKLNFMKEKIENQKNQCNLQDNLLDNQLYQNYDKSNDEIQKTKIDQEQQTDQENFIINYQQKKEVSSSSKHANILQQEISRLEQLSQKKDAKLEQIVIDYNDLSIIVNQKDEIIQQMAFILPQFKNSQIIIEKLLQLLEQKEAERNQEKASQMKNSQQCIDNMIGEMNKLQEVVKLKDEQLDKEQKKLKEVQKQCSDQKRVLTQQNDLQKKNEIQMKIILNENKQNQIEIDILQNKLRYYENLPVQKVKNIRNNSQNNFRHKSYNQSSEKDKYDQITQFESQQFSPLSKNANNMNVQKNILEVKKQFYQRKLTEF